MLKILSSTCRPSRFRIEYLVLTLSKPKGLLETFKCKTEIDKVTNAVDHTGASDFDRPHDRFKIGLVKLNGPPE